MTEEKFPKSTAQASLQKMQDNGLIKDPNGKPEETFKFCFALGVKTASDGKYLIEDLEISNAMTDALGSQIELSSCTPYDPGGNKADKLMEEEIEGIRKTLGFLQPTELRLIQEEEQTRQEKDDFEQDHVQPAYNPLLTGAGIAFMVVVFCPFFYQYVFFTFDWLRSILALLSAFLLSGFLALFILIGATTSSEKSKTNVAGYVLATVTTSLILIRAVLAESWLEIFWGIGLTLFEVAILMVFVHYADTLRKQFSRYSVARTKYIKWQSIKKSLCDCREVKQQLITKLGSYRLMIESREKLSSNLPKYVEAAKKAFIAGYKVGIAENRKHIS